jgi:hypothetical protein
MPPVLSYPLDPIDEGIIRKAVSDRILGPAIFDAVWRNLYYYSFQYESLDGLSLQGNVPTIDSTGITMATAAVLNSTSGIVKDATAQKALTFGKRQAFRLTLEFGAASLSNVTAHFSVGVFGIGENYYGFELANSTLKGSSSNGNTSTTNAVTLATLSGATSYEIEACLDPIAKRVVFLVNGVEKGNVTTEIPSGTSASGVLTPLGNIIDWQIKTTDANAKTVSIGNFELIQQRYSNQ